MPNDASTLAQMPVGAPTRPRIGRDAWRIGLLTLIGRDLKRYFKDWIESIVAPAFSTLLYLAVFALALGADSKGPEGRAILVFMLPGLILFAVVNKAAETTVFSLAFDKMERMIWDILMAPLTPRQLVIGYVAAGTVAGIVTGLPTLIAALAVFDLEVQSPLIAIFFGITGSAMLATVGVVIGLWTDKWDHVGAFFGFLLLPTTFLSGMFAPIELLPRPLEIAVQFNPVFYMMDGFRAGFTGHHVAPLWMSALVGLATVAAIAVLAERLIARGWKIRS